MYHGNNKKKMAMGGMYIGAQPRQKMMIGGMAAKGLFGAGKNLVGQLFDDKKGVNFGQVAQAGMRGAVGDEVADALQQTPFMQRFQQMKGGMNGVKLMKGGAVYAQDGVNTNGVDGDTTSGEPGAFSMGIQMASDSLEAAKNQLLNGLSEKELERARELGIIENQDNMSFYDIWSSLGLSDGEARGAINRSAGRDTQESARLKGAFRNIDRAHEIFDDAGISFDEGLSRLDQQMANKGYVGQGAENFSTYLGTSELNLGNPMWKFLADPTRSNLQGDFKGSGGRNFALPTYDAFEEQYKSTFLGLDAGQKGITRQGEVGEKAIDSGALDMILRAEKLGRDFEPSKRRERTYSKGERKRFPTGLPGREGGDDGDGKGSATFTPGTDLESMPRRQAEEIQRVQMIRFPEIPVVGERPERPTLPQGFGDPIDSYLPSDYLGPDLRFEQREGISDVRRNLERIGLDSMGGVGRQFKGGRTPSNKVRLMKRNMERGGYNY